MPTSVTRARLPTTFARIAVPTLVCASGEPLGIRTWGVTERRLLGVKLTAAAAKAGEPGAGVPVAGTVPICPKDRLNGAVPVVVNVSPRMGDASAEPASGAARKTAGSDWSPSRDATETAAEVEVRQLQHEAPHAGAAAVVGQGEGGHRQTAIGSRLGLDCVEVDSRSRVPEPSEATVVDMLASCAVARTGGISAYKADARRRLPSEGSDDAGAAGGEAYDERRSAIEATGHGAVSGFDQDS